MGWWSWRAWRLACRLGEESQQPIWPQVWHMRRCTQLPPIRAATTARGRHRTRSLWARKNLASHEPHALGSGRVGHALADQHLARARVGGDPGGQLHGAAEVVPALDHHRPGRHPDMDRRQAGLGSSATSRSADSTAPAGSR